MLCIVFLFLMSNFFNNFHRKIGHQKNRRQQEKKKQVYYVQHSVLKYLRPTPLDRP